MAKARRSLILVMLLAASLLAMPARAAEARPVTEDAALEARVMAIAEELRCLVCQNETIAASQADLARDLRAQIRQQLREGRSAEDVMDFMVARYGQFVRYRPPLQATTWALWLGPFALLALAGFAWVRQMRRTGQGDDAEGPAHDKAGGLAGAHPSHGPGTAPQEPA